MKGASLPKDVRLSEWRVLVEPAVKARLVNEAFWSAAGQEAEPLLLRIENRALIIRHGQAVLKKSVVAVSEVEKSRLRLHAGAIADGIRMTVASLRRFGGVAVRWNSSFRHSVLVGAVDRASG